MKHLHIIRTIAFILLLTVWTSLSADKLHKAVDIGTNKQLFLDHSLIDTSEGIIFNMNPPTRTGQIVLKADAPWEKALNGHVSAYSSVIKEGDKIRLWYDVRFGGNVQVAYAESDDGIHFTKPIVGKYLVEGSMDNNIVMPGRIGGGAVWIDPMAPAEKRYRSQSKGYNPPTAEKLYCYYSADGINWTLWQHQDIGDFDAPEFNPIGIVDPCVYFIAFCI